MIRRCPIRSAGVLACLRKSRCFRGRCPWLSACLPRKLPRARTYSGQRCRAEWHTTSFTQVNSYVKEQAGAVCKTVGFAFGGSNPPPATTCENGPSAADTRLCGPFLLGPAMCHLVALCTGVLRCPRTYSGRRPAARTVGVTAGFHGRPRTESRVHGRATDGPRVAWRPRLSGVCNSLPIDAMGWALWLGIPVRNVTYRRPRPVAAGCGHGDDRRAGICAWLCSGCCVPFVYVRHEALFVRMEVEDLDLPAVVAAG